MLTPEQIAMRKTGVGSSEIAAVAGLDPYRRAIDVYAAKLGIAPAFEGNAFTRWGNKLEEVIAEAYAEERGVVLSSPGTMRHPEHPVVIATPDRLVHAKKGAPASKVLEIKNVGARMAHLWGAVGDDVPENYLCQVQWEQAASGVHDGDLAALLGGNDLRVFAIPYDGELVGQLIEIGERFYRDHVQAEKPPPVDGSENYGDFLKHRFPRDTRKMLPATADAKQLAADLAEALEDEKRIGEHAEGLKNKLKAIIGDAAGIEGLCTWKAAKDSQKTDWEAVLRALAVPVPAQVIATHTTTRPGSRRFLLK